jgi:ABC-2 type transport system permease protein
MRALTVLVAMQARERFNFSLRDRKTVLFKAVFAVAEFALVTAAVYAVFSFLVFFGIVTLTARFPVTVMTLLLAVILLMSAVTVTGGLVRSLYFSHDNRLLLTLPVTPGQVCASKLLLFYLNELKKNYLLLLPVFVAYGLVNGANGWFYPILFVSYFVLSALPVALGALLSIPMLFIALGLRGRHYVHLGFAAAAAAGILYILFKTASGIPADFNLITRFGSYYWQIQEFLNGFSQRFAVFKALTEMVTGRTEMFVNAPAGLHTLYTLLGCIGGSAVVLTGAFFIQRVLFFEMVSRSGDHDKGDSDKGKPNPVNSPFVSGLKKEALGFARAPSRFFAEYTAILLLPFAVYLLNRIFANMDTRTFGDQLAMGFNLLMILLITLNSNSACASALSREGKAVYVLKTSPVPFNRAAAAKLFPHAAILLVSICAATVIAAALGAFTAGQAVMLLLTVLLINAAHIMWGVERDVTHPQYDKYFDGEHIGLNPNEAFITAMAFLLSFLFAAAGLFLFTDGMGTAWIKLTALAAALAALRVYLLRLKLRAYTEDF